MSILSEPDRKAILTGNGKVIAEQAEKLAASLQSVGTSQIRSFYGPLTRLRDAGQGLDRLNQLHLMRPRLVYMRARSKDNSAQPLQAQFEALISSADPSDPKQVDAILDYAEAVVAYHKQYDKGGRS